MLITSDLEWREVEGWPRPPGRREWAGEVREDSFFVCMAAGEDRDGGLGAEWCLARRRHGNGGFEGRG